MDLLLPVVAFLVLGVLGLYALQVAKNAAYVIFVIMFGMATWYVVAPVVKQYQLNERVLSILPAQEGKVAQDIFDNLDNLPSRSAMEEKMKPAVDKLSKDAQQLHAGAEEETKDEEEQEEHEPSLLNKIIKAVLQVLADSF